MGVLDLPVDIAAEPLTPDEMASIWIREEEPQFDHPLPERLSWMSRDDLARLPVAPMEYDTEPVTSMTAVEAIAAGIDLTSDDDGELVYELTADDGGHAMVVAAENAAFTMDLAAAQATRAAERAERYADRLEAQNDGEVLDLWSRQFDGPKAAPKRASLDLSNVTYEEDYDGLSAIDLANRIDADTMDEDAVLDFWDAQFGR